jgi:hypothetical protein
MSGPSPVTPRDCNDLSQNALEDEQKEAAVEIGNNLELKSTDDAGGRDRVLVPLFISSIRKDEPIVTRRELWSYYR